ncbi:hypothetical protein [Methylobacterium indicum]|uniref:Phage gp6-like head-tail connector protein n=1 Tax=Methylobacterium indicum TaxID=1775910 RepID=A0ABR5GZ68_9HYPH|nr:hypothetical protein [Methylobacterium indicum]KMO15778.1 hypothetical protein QR79_23875 [Methylobacterium indicum]KMO18054.1 hypothetical protein QR78_16220 [Methylobacterium indicum]
MTLTVLTAATEKRLTTVERARAMLGFAAADDIAVGMMLDQASSLIAQFCRRPFGVETLRERPSLLRDCGGLVLSRDPVVEVISVTRGTDDVLAPADYEIDASGKVLYLLQDGQRCGSPNWCFDHNCHPDGRGFGLTVEYRAGYTLPGGDAESTLPPDVERAAIMSVSTMLSSRGRDPLLKSENVMGMGSFTYATPAASTPAGGLVNAEAQALLWPYVRAVLG